MVCSGLDFGAIFTAAGLAKLGQMIIGDLTMAGDNVVIMSSLASGLRHAIEEGAPVRRRHRAGLPDLCRGHRDAPAKVTGLVFAGGLLLLWVAYNMWGDLSPRPHVAVDHPELRSRGPAPARPFSRPRSDHGRRPQHEPRQCAAGRVDCARQSGLLFIGLTFSVLFMGLAANYVARLIERYSWINYIGLAVILWVACNMIYEGWVGGGPVLGLTSAPARLASQMDRS